MASVELPNQDGAVLQQKLYDDFRIEIPIFPWEERNLLRISIQAYNDEGDVGRLLSALKQLL
jgi:selenocysteine lyase/cysteine desulfurase